uniref:Putative secreted peptide n=1 Tax=Anopheles braziliensis TaxID=58242 RepID=A0A2M3ZX66_9DIPT
MQLQMIISHFVSHTLVVAASSPQSGGGNGWIYPIHPPKNTPAAFASAENGQSYRSLERVCVAKRWLFEPKKKKGKKNPPDCAYYCQHTSRSPPDVVCIRQ